MKIIDILKGSAYSLDLFDSISVDALDARIKEKENKKGGIDAYVQCIIRDKEIKLTPEEVVSQLYTEQLISKYGYNKERIVFEFPVYFGRETKRADIVIRDKDDVNVAYIIVEVKKPKAKDGREQLKSYTHATGASMAVWTNGTTYCRNSKGADATAYHREDGFYVQSGSVCVKELTATGLKTPYITTSRQRLLKEKVLQQEGNKLSFAAEYKFATPSGAAQIVLGTASNGWVTWKDANGKTLDEHFRQE